jgi:hypothetical protein
MTDELFAPFDRDRSVIRKRDELVVDDLLELVRVGDVAGVLDLDDGAVPAMDLNGLAVDRDGDVRPRLRMRILVALSSVLLLVVHRSFSSFLNPCVDRT